MEHEAVFTVAEVAERLRLSRGWIYRLCTSGRLRHYKAGRVIRIPESAVNGLQRGGDSDGDVVSQD